jgi:hypothetical protein
MNHKFLIINFEFLIPSHPHFTTVGRGSFKIQNSKFKIFTGMSENEHHA